MISLSASAATYKPVIYPQGSVTDSEKEVWISANSIMLDNQSTVQYEINDIFKELNLQKKQLSNLKKIIGKNLPIPTQSGTLEYNGTPQRPVWSNYEEGVFCYVSGQTYGTNAGEYKVTFTLIEEDFQWSDGTKEPKEVLWTISRQKITTFPSQATPYPSYTGNVIVPEFENFPTSKISMVSGVIKSADVGTHIIMVAPGANYAWSDGTYDARPLYWQVTGSATQVGNPALTSGSLLFYNGTRQYPNFNYNSLAVDMTGETSGIDARDYTAVFTPKEGFEWEEEPKGSVRAVPWTINTAVIKKK